MDGLSRAAIGDRKPIVFGIPDAAGVPGKEKK